MEILVVNAGSSSLKYQLFNMEDESVQAKGLCERIGIDGQIKHTKYVGDEEIVYKADISFPTHKEAMAAATKMLIDPEYGVLSSMSEIQAVGHRFAHGGESFTQSVKIDDSVIEGLEKTVIIAPLHSPPNLQGIKACRDIIGDVPMVCVFDTSFHQTMPKKAYVYATPYEFYDNQGIRRYGFHGTSHRYVAERAAAMMGKPLDSLKLISCHMGNGSSICAVDCGKSVDTSMGFTPTAGLPMGTRCGDIDPGIINFVCENNNLSVTQMFDILNKKSGVLGISGLSSDFRDLSEAADAGNERAALALEIFTYSVVKTIGSYAAAMGGVDGIIFTAGIGENMASLRQDVCQQMAWLGCEFDAEANNCRGVEKFITTPNSKLKAMIIPTNEELVIARDTQAIVCGK